MDRPGMPVRRGDAEVVADDVDEEPVEEPVEAEAGDVAEEEDYASPADQATIVQLWVGTYRLVREAEPDLPVSVLADVAARLTMAIDPAAPFVVPTRGRAIPTEGSMDV